MKRSITHRILSMLMALTMTFALAAGPLQTMAAAVDSAPTSVWQNWGRWSTPFDLGDNHPTTAYAWGYINGDNGEVTYCLNHYAMYDDVYPAEVGEILVKNLWSNTWAPLTTESAGGGTLSQQDLLQFVMFYGYSKTNNRFLGKEIQDPDYSNPNGNVASYYMATQIIVWQVAHGLRTSFAGWQCANTEQSLRSIGKGNVADAYHDLEAKLMDVTINGNQPVTVPDMFDTSAEGAWGEIDKAQRTIDLGNLASESMNWTLSFNAGNDFPKKFTHMTVTYTLGDHKSTMTVKAEGKEGDALPVKESTEDYEKYIKQATYSKKTDGSTSITIEGPQTNIESDAILSVYLYQNPDDAGYASGQVLYFLAKNDHSGGKDWQPRVQCLYDEPKSQTFALTARFSKADMVTVEKQWWEREPGFAFVKKIENGKTTYEKACERPSSVIGTLYGVLKGGSASDPNSLELIQENLELTGQNKTGETMFEKEVDNSPTTPGALPQKEIVYRTTWEKKVEVPNKDKYSSYVFIEDWDKFSTSEQQEYYVEGAPDIENEDRTENETNTANAVSVSNKDKEVKDKWKRSTEVPGPTPVPINAPPPDFTFPTLNVEIEKDDKFGGWDDNIHTARGDAALDATFSVTIGGGGSGSGTTQAPQDGHYGSYTFKPWNSTANGTCTDIKFADEDVSSVTLQDGSHIKESVPLCDGSEGSVDVYQKWEFDCTITTTEIAPPEGYFLETEDENPGSGTRIASVHYIMEAKRYIRSDQWIEIIPAVYETQEDGSQKLVQPEKRIPHTGPGETHSQSETSEHLNVDIAPWEYVYTVIPAGDNSTRQNTTTGTAHKGYTVTEPVFANDVWRGAIHLTKTFEDDLDPWTDWKDDVNGSTYAEDTYWTLEVVDCDDSGNPFTTGGSYETQPYAVVRQVKQGDAGGKFDMLLNAGANVYIAARDGSGNSLYTPATGTIIKADAGKNHDESTANTKNVLRTGRTGEIYVYDLPYGYYKMSEIRCDANEGYVLETVFFKVDEHTTVIDRDGTKTPGNQVIKNELVVKKVDHETGKAIPAAGTAFRIRYLGYYDLDRKFHTNDHSQTYITNGSSVQDGYQFVFYTDATGKMKVPYELEYGLYQLEEITAPYGYYIGNYSGNGSTPEKTDGTLGYYDTVAIFDNNGNKVDYVNDNKVAFNYWTFEVSEQTKTDPDNDGIYTLNVVINNVIAENNSVKGKIEVKKIGEKLVGFRVEESEYGEVLTPVYEMQPIPGATFEVVAATDITLNDGYETPELLTHDWNKLDTPIEKFTHQLWPDAESIVRNDLADGTETYSVTTRFSNNTGNLTHINEVNMDNVGTGKDSNDGGATTNLISSNILTSLKKGIQYTLKYSVETLDPRYDFKAKGFETYEEMLESMMAKDAEGNPLYTDEEGNALYLDEDGRPLLPYDKPLSYTSDYEIEIGLEYAVGGWNYSSFDISRTTRANDFIDNIPGGLPIVKWNGTEYDLGAVKYNAGQTITLEDGGSIEIVEKDITFENLDKKQAGGPADRLYVNWYDPFEPEWGPMDAYNYLTEDDELELEVPEEYLTEVEVTPTPAPEPTEEVKSSEPNLDNAPAPAPAPGTEEDLPLVEDNELNTSDPSAIVEAKAENEPVQEMDEETEEDTVVVLDDIIPLAAGEGDPAPADPPKTEKKAINVSPYGGYVYKTTTAEGKDKYIHAVIGEDGKQKWVESESPDKEIKEGWLNAPDVTEWTADGWAFGPDQPDVETEFIIREDSDDAVEHSDVLFTLTKDDEVMVYMTNTETKENVWVKLSSLVYTYFDSIRDSYDTPIPSGFTLSTLNFNFGYMAVGEEGDFISLVQVDGEEEPRWIYYETATETHMSRSEHVEVNLNESNTSESGFEVTLGDFYLTDYADHNGNFAIASIHNPSDEDYTLICGEEYEVTTSEDGKTVTIKVIEPEPQAFWNLPDNTKVGITYQGGFTKTWIYVPQGNEFPIIKWKGQPVDYGGYDLNPMDPEKTVTISTGTYVHAFYDQANQQYLVEVVSNSTDKDNGFTIDYYSGHNGYSVVVDDPETGMRRGQLTVYGIGKTLVYQSGVVIETLTTGENGMTVSKELPLGTYYVREVDAGLGYTISTDSYQVDLEYAGQYVPLIWNGTTIENDALNVNIDIAKSFQEAYDSNNYIYQAGAVFGVFSNEDITATNPAVSEKTEFDVETAPVNSLLKIVTIGEDGYAKELIKLPYGKDYYVREIDTLDGYELSDVKYLFRVDETSVADNLTFRFDHDGIKGDINQTDLFETTVTIDTLYQVPARTIVVNGVEVSSLEAIEEETIAGAALITNEVTLDRARLTVKATAAEPTVITFDNGSQMVITVMSDGYTAIMTEPTEDGCQLVTNTGNVASTSIKKETLETGETKFTYNPVIAHTGYSVDLTDTYKAPETTMSTEDDIRVSFEFDKASNHRIAILEYPHEIDLNETIELYKNWFGTNTPAWLDMNGDAQTVRIDMDGLFAANHEDDQAVYWWKVYQHLIHGKMSGEGVEIVLNSESKTLTEKDVLDLSKAKATFDGEKAKSFSVDAEGLSILNYVIEGFVEQLNDLPAMEENTLRVLEVSEPDIKGILTVRVEKADGKVYIQKLDTVNGEPASEENAPVAGLYYGYTEDRSKVLALELLDIEANVDPVPTIKDIAYTGEVDVSSNDGEGRELHLRIPVKIMGSNFTSVDLTWDDLNEVMPLSLVDAENAPDEFVEDVTGQTNAVWYKYDSTTPEPTEEDPNPVTKLESEGKWAIYGKDVFFDIMVGNFKVATEGHNTNAPAGVKEDHFALDYETQDDKEVTWIMHEDKQFVVASEKEQAAIAVSLNHDSTLAWLTMVRGNVVSAYVDASPIDVLEAEPLVPEHPITVLADDGTTFVAKLSKDGVFEIHAENMINGDLSTGDSAPHAVVLNSYPFEESSAKMIYENTPFGSNPYVEFSETVTFSRSSNKVNSVSVKVNSATQNHITDKQEEGEINGRPNDVENDVIRVIFTKEDHRAKRLEGAVIAVFNESGEEVFRGTTDANGELVWQKAPAGKYKYQEIEAPKGHALIEGDPMYDFEVLKDGTIIGINTLFNKPIDVWMDKVDSETGKPVADAVIGIYDKDGKEVYRGTSDKNGELVWRYAEPGEYTYKEIKAPTGYMLDKKAYKFSIDKYGNVEGDMTLLNIPIKVEVKFDKRAENANGNPLNGAVFAIYDKDGKEVWNGTTANNGTIVWKDAPAGEYTFKELTAPEGYELDKNTYRLDITVDGDITSNGSVTSSMADNGTVTAVITMVNKKVNVERPYEPDEPTPPKEEEIPDNPVPEVEALLIHKTDATDGAGVPGAQITIWNKDTNEVIFSGITDSNGDISFPKPGTGTYIFREVVAPEGYLINEEVFEFRIDANGNVIGKMGIKDIREGTVVIHKYDVLDKEPLEGAIIAVYDRHGHELFRQETDEYGQIYFVPTEAGTYYFREWRAPAGYYLNEDLYSFTIDEEGFITEGTTWIENVPEGTVVIKKTDVSDGTELPGALITIWDENDNVVFEGWTDERGRVYFETPGPGTYKFREILAPEGYTINEEIFFFSIDEDNIITGATHIEDEKEEEVVEVEVPKTGDNMFLFVLMAVTSTLGLAMLEATSIKARRKERCKG